MKIVVFENEFKEIENAFKSVKILMNKDLIIDVFKDSQSLNPFEKILNYDIVFVDLDLVPKSIFDGYEIIKELKKINADSNIPIYVITGHTNGEEELKNRNIENIPIIEKPLGFEDLIKIISKYKK